MEQPESKMSLLFAGGWARGFQKCLGHRYLYVEISAFRWIPPFSCALTRSLLWGAAMTMWWMLCLSVSSMPKSKEHRSATRHGGSSSGRRSSPPGTIRVRTTWPPISFTNRSSEGWSLGSIGVTRWVSSTASSLVQLISLAWQSMLHQRGREIFLHDHLLRLCIMVCT